MRLIADLWTSSELLYIRKDPSRLSFSFFASSSPPSVFGFFLIRNRISACYDLSCQSTWGLYTYLYLQLLFLLRTYFFFFLFLCALHSVDLTLRSNFSGNTGLHFQIFFGSTLGYSWAVLWDILGLHFEVFLGSTLRYSWAPLWDILGLHFEIFLGSTIR